MPTRLAALLLLLMGLGHNALADTTHCKGTLYLSFDTGNMRHAEFISDTLKKHGAKATFFVANEKTLRGDWSLDPSWGAFWQARVSALGLNN